MVGRIASVLAVLCFAQVTSAQVLVNGSFTTGDLTGWTVFTTLNGNNGPGGLPTVTSFDVTGGGAQNAAQFEVGETVFGTGYQGGGLEQSVLFPTAGVATLSEDFAAQGDTAVSSTNASGGRFELLIDGNVIASDEIGAIGADAIIRGSLLGSAPVTAGSHVIAVRMLRPFTNAGPGITPFQYVTNITLSGASGTTPVPAAPAVVLIGGSVFAWCTRRRSRTS